MQIVKLDTSRTRDAQRFALFPYELYRGSEYWVPPLRSDARKQVDPRRNPFFLHSEADFYVAEEGNDVVGRIVVMENRNYNNYHKVRYGFFFLFDVVDDQRVADALYGTAIDWCRERGLTRLIGPKGFTVFEGMGILVEGFSQLPAMGVPYNYPYYGPLTENAGFQKEVDFTSYHIYIPDFTLPERVARLAGQIEKRRGLRARPLRTMEEVRNTVMELVEAYNTVFTENWEYVPVTREEADAVAAQMLQITRPDMVKVIENREGELVGFLLSFINIGRAMQRCGGRLFPFGWFHLLRGLRSSKYVDVNGMGILDEYRGLGGNIIMYNELYNSIGRDGRFEHADMTQMADFVVNMLSDANTLGGAPYKVHRVYRAEID
ncbi:MAG: hypothetical protein ACK2UX_20545 [Anaerolineae bacterium]